MARAAVALWWDVFREAPDPRLLTLVYVANDIMQNSKRRGPEFVDAFCGVIGDALCVTAARTPKLRSKLERLLDVWRKRKVVSRTHLDRFRDQLGGDPAAILAAFPRGSSAAGAAP